MLSLLSRIDDVVESATESEQIGAVKVNQDSLERIATAVQKIRSRLKKLKRLARFIGEIVVTVLFIIQILI